MRGYVLYFVMEKYVVKPFVAMVVVAAEVSLDGVVQLIFALNLFWLKMEFEIL